MFALIFIAGFIFTLIFFKKKRDIEKQGNKKKFLYHFYKNSLEFLIPFVIVALFYFIFSKVLIILVASESVSLHFLIQLEEFLIKLNSYFSIFKFSAIEVFVIFVMLYLLNILRISIEKSKKLSRLFDKYQILTRRIYIVLILLCSFTLFGSQLNDPSKDLRVRIKTIREGFGNISQEVQEILSEEVAIRLYKKVYDSFPQSYRDALELQVKIESHITSLRDYYKSAQDKYGIRDYSVESIIDKGLLRIQTASDLEGDIKIIDEMNKKKMNSIDPNPRKISYRKTKEAKKTIEQYKSKTQSKVFTLIRIEGGKKVTSQVLKILTTKIKTKFFQQLIARYPILEPLIDVLIDTIDDKIYSSIEKAVDHIINLHIQSPKSL